jgi:hypothetical protein
MTIADTLKRWWVGGLEKGGYNDFSDGLPPRPVPPSPMHPWGSSFPHFAIDYPMPTRTADPKPDFEAMWKADNSRLAVESRLAEELESALRDAEREIAVLRRQRAARDAFLVQSGLWQRFTDWLPKGADAVKTFHDELDSRAATADAR